MIPGLALLWAAGLGDAAPNLPRLRLSFQGRCTWQIEGRLEVNRKRAQCGKTCWYQHMHAHHWTLAGLGAFLGHLQLTLF